MTKLTKAQLAAENAALRVELNALRTINAEHQALLAQAREVIARAQPSPNLISQNKPERPVYAPPAWQQERRAKMEEAKHTAMQFGIMTKVAPTSTHN